jgi:membrane-bound ClpP family serine protease
MKKKYYWVILIIIGFLIFFFDFNLPISILLIVITGFILGINEIEKNRKKKITSIIVFLIATITIILLFFLYLYFVIQSGWGPTTVEEATKNVGCITYLNQNPACSDATVFNVTYQGLSISFYDFMHNANTYNCADETCIKQRCICSGY